MQSGNFRTGRLSRPPLSLFRKIAGIVIATILLVVVSSVSAEESPGRYGPISAKRWLEEDIRSLPDGPQRIERELHRQGEYSRRWNLIHELVGKQHVSRKSRDLLRTRGLGPALVDKGDGGQQWSGAAGADQDVVRVLIIRMSFDTNRDPNLTTIDPSGDFVLEPLTDPKPLEVDPPPRNKAFFEAHLEGLSEYYKFMSGGRLQIEGRVLPEDSEASYKLSDVADYGPGAGNFWTLEGLERLVQDIMVKADQETQADGSVNLAEYDDSDPFTYIIFVHAGSDWQSDTNGDSPNDIPTFFVTLGEPIDLIGDNAQGQTGKLSECSIIPETTNQDGYQGSIAAAFYHEFGHALGLPDVYSTYSGLPSVGIWDLMDSGTNLPVNMGVVVAPGDTFTTSATGVLPPSLSAWNKWFLGWLEMGELDGREYDYLLPAVGVPREQYPLYNVVGDFNRAYPQAYRAGLSPREWFLLENRWVPVNVGETPFSDIRFERDEATGVIQYLAGFVRNAWVNSGLYDFFLPGGGVLVWHVNSDRIESNLPDNTINRYGDGLKLVEADGIQDIGVLEAYVRGWYGSPLDPFGGYDSAGNFNGFHDLHVEGFPSSRNFDRSWSGLSLSEVMPRTEFSTSVMKFKANQATVGPGFPHELPRVELAEAPGAQGLPGPRGIDIETLTAVSLRSGDNQVLIFSDTAPDSFSGGDYPASLFFRWDDGGVRWVSLDDIPGAFQALGAPLSGSPYVTDSADGGVDLVWGTTAGRVGMNYLPDFGQPTATWSVQAGDSLGGGPIPLIWQGTGQRILCPVFPDLLVVLDGSGAVLDSLAISGSTGGLKVAAPVVGLGESDLVPVLTGDGWHLVRQDAAGLAVDPEYIPFARSVSGDPRWTAVIRSGDGYQLHVFDTEGELGCWRIEPDGSVADLGSVLGLAEPLVAAPAIADVDGDGNDDLVIVTDSRIFALRPDGVSLRGFPVRFYDLFPLPDSTAVAGPVVIADGTGDGVNEIYFNTDGGHLVGLDATGRLLPRMPLRWADRRTGGLTVGGPAGARALWLVSPGGYTGPPLDRQLVNGRVIALGLANALDAGSRTSEWRGPAGGSYRRGSEGEAKNLGSAAPSAAETDRVVLYPNPMVGDGVTVRFFSAGSRAARLTIYNLEGEEVVQAEIPVTAGSVNEFPLSLPGIVSGLYLARIEYDTGSGMEIRTLTLAVER